MATQTTTPLIKAQVPKGFGDLEGHEAALVRQVCRTLEEVYALWGFSLLETPAFEYTECLGKFLPDVDRPGAGVFSFQDDDDRWMSLRYDLTAPLARYVAQHYDRLPKPYRSYRCGYVFRNEKPGVGRFRQFIQCDVDTVGTTNPLSDAEVCLAAAHALEKLGIAPQQMILKINNRKMMDGLLEKAEVRNEAQKLIVMRALDKHDRLGKEGVRELLGEGRKDISGDFTRGAGLTSSQAAYFLNFLETSSLEQARLLLSGNERGEAGLAELEAMLTCAQATSPGECRMRFDPSVVRGLGYYTGPVFEAELLTDVMSEEGLPMRFGAIGGGGRYDDLVSRFQREQVPATGFSIGVSRLCSALSAMGMGGKDVAPLVVVLVLEPNQSHRYQAMVSSLRKAGISAELYLGSSGLKAQMKYADRRGACLALLQGEDERARNEVQVKDLASGLKQSSGVLSREGWLSERAAQFSVKEDTLVESVLAFLKQLRDPS